MRYLSKEVIHATRRSLAHGRLTEEGLYAIFGIVLQSGVRNCTYIAEWQKIYIVSAVSHKVFPGQLGRRCCWEKSGTSCIEVFCPSLGLEMLNSASTQMFDVYLSPGSCVYRCNWPVLFAYRNICSMLSTNRSLVFTAMIYVVVLAYLAVYSYLCCLIVAA